MKKNILIGAQVFCWQKFINPLGQKPAFGWFLSCVGINQIKIKYLFHKLRNDVVISGLQLCDASHNVPSYNAYFEMIFRKICTGFWYLDLHHANYCEFPIPWQFFQVHRQWLVHQLSTWKDYNLIWEHFLIHLPHNLNGRKLKKFVQPIVEFCRTLWPSLIQKSSSRKQEIKTRK